MAGILPCSIPTLRPFSPCATWWIETCGWPPRGWRVAPSTNAVRLRVVGGAIYQCRLTSCVPRLSHGHWAVVVLDIQRSRRFMLVISIGVAAPGDRTAACHPGLWCS